MRWIDFPITLTFDKTFGKEPINEIFDHYDQPEANTKGFGDSDAIPTAPLFSNDNPTDPYPIYGYVVEDFVLVGPGFDVYVEWTDKNNQTIPATPLHEVTNAISQYSVDLYDYTDNSIVWENATGVDYTGYNSTVINMAENAGDHVDIFNGVLPSYAITLHDGWNLISFPLIPSDTSVENLLDSISGNWDTVKWYDPSDQADHWKSYRMGMSTNDLTDIDNTMGFWLHVTDSTDDLVIYGTEPVIINISLSAGWNLVSYPCNTTDIVANALWGTGADRVECYDGSSSYLISEMGPAEMMMPGNGYWVHVSADSIWAVDY